MVATVKQNRVDAVVGLLVVSILLLGGVATWSAYQQWTALEGMHMGAAMHGTHPIWYLLGTVGIAVVTAGVYVGVRDRIVSAVETPGQGEPTDAAPPDHEAAATGSEPSGDAQKRQVLDLLPDDERRILEPVFESPGLTQIELRDRSNFSKSKVSQTVTDLEKRGLLYREPQGRTYRIYPADDIDDRL